MGVCVRMSEWGTVPEAVGPEVASEPTDGQSSRTTGLETKNVTLRIADPLIAMDPFHEWKIFDVPLRTNSDESDRNDTRQFTLRES